MPAPALDCSGKNAVTVTLTGDWLLVADLPAVEPVLERLRASPPPGTVTFACDGLGQWDTALVASLVSIRRVADDRGVGLDPDGLPEGARRLLTLAFAVKEREGARRGAVAEPLVAVASILLPRATVCSPAR